MRHLVVAGMIVGCLAAWAAAQEAAPPAESAPPAEAAPAEAAPPAPVPPEPAPPEPVPPEAAPLTVQQLSERLTELEQTLRRTQNPQARQRLLEELEEIRHQAGPTDVAGNRVHPKAMWHDQALERLEGDIKRLSGGGDTAGATAADSVLATIRRGRLQVRRMARACLEHGWRLGPCDAKYQVDVFGQYLANNLPVLDRVFQRLSSLPRAAPAEGEAEAGPSVPEGVSEGIAVMTEAADALADATPARTVSVDPVPLLARFTEGLVQVRDAVEAAGAKAAPAPSGDAASGGDGAPAGGESDAEPPPITDAERERLAAVRAAAEGLDGDAWAPVRECLLKYATIIEAGFSVASARPKARELLTPVAEAADYARRLAASRLLTPEVLAACRQDLARVLESMERPMLRADACAWLSRLLTHDLLRRRLEEAKVDAEAVKPLVAAYYGQKSEQENAPVEDIQFAHTCRSISSALGRMASWPPDGMAPGLRQCYDRQADRVLRGIEAAGRALPEDREQGVARLASAGAKAGDLALIVRADAVVQAVRRYRPARAAAMVEQVTEAAKALVFRTDGAAEPRTWLQNLVRPFEDLAAFPAPDAMVSRSLVRLLGRGFTASTTKLSHDLGAAIDAAATGDPAPLLAIMRAKGLFGLARKRALADAARLERADVANLVAFSVPEEVWKTFCDQLDRQLRAMFAEFLQGYDQGRWLTVPAMLEATYGPVLSAQRLTLDARSAGESDLHFLVRNLQRSAVADPPDDTRAAWVVGYHATEAAVAALAEFDNVADWHRHQMAEASAPLAQVDLVPPVTGRER